MTKIWKVAFTVLPWLDILPQNESGKKDLQQSWKVIVVFGKNIIKPIDLHIENSFVFFDLWSNIKVDFVKLSATNSHIKCVYNICTFFWVRLFNRYHNNFTTGSFGMRGIGCASKHTADSICQYLHAKIHQQWSWISVLMYEIIQNDVTCKSGLSRLTWLQPDDVISL